MTAAGCPHNSLASHRKPATQFVMFRRRRPTSVHFPRQGVDICKPSVVAGHTSLSAVQKVRSVRVGPTEIQIAKGLCLKVKSHSYHTHVRIMSQLPKIGVMRVPVGGSQPVNKSAALVAGMWDFAFGMPPTRQNSRRTLCKDKTIILQG